MVNNQSVRRHLDAFTRSRIIGKLEEGRSVTSVATEFGIAHSIVSRLWRQFQNTGTAIQEFSSGRPRGTTPADERYIVLQARRNRRQTVGEIARHTTQTTGRPISRFTVARRLHGGGLFARRPVRCVPLTPTHRRRRSLWCREHRNCRDNEWGRVLFTDESRFSLSSDSHRILIWRERGSRNHPSNIIERDRYGGRGVLVWGGIMLGSRTDLHIFDAGSVNGTRYCNEILLPYVRLFRGAMGLQFLFMDDNAPCHRTVAAEQLLESRRLAARTLPPVTIRELRLALQNEWAAMPQQLIDTLILSMDRRCETCLAEVLGPVDPKDVIYWLKYIWDRSAHYMCCPSCPPIDASVWSGAAHEETGLQWNGTKSSVATRARELRFNLSSDDNRVRVWRFRGEHLNPAVALQLHTAPTAGVIISCPIACNTRSSLVWIHGIMTAQQYV
ncbi:transposable element Tcb2 transposase [Trichonephila clavipes]|nr:transposable element Tcb2 transposase [Trichonephila clavipes]